VETHQSVWHDCLVGALALAARLEEEGQNNIAKLLRAAADAQARQAAYRRPTPSDRAGLVGGIHQTAHALAAMGVSAELVAVLARGAAAMDEGRLPLIHETPHPYVCRTCGYLRLEAPPDRCPTCGARPATFQPFPPVYWLDALDPFAALERLRQTPLEVAALVQGLPGAAMDRLPAGGGWSIRHALSHLRDAQGVLSFRLDLLLAEENPVLESKAVFEWATREEEHPPSGADILETYQDSRRETVARLESIPLRDWWRTGRHEEFGAVTLRAQVSYFAAHEITHLPQLEALRDEVVGG
jgi:hypothetical protein